MANLPGGRTVRDVGGGWGSRMGRPVSRVTIWGIFTLRIDRVRSAVDVELFN